MTARVLPPDHTVRISDAQALKDTTGELGAIQAILDGCPHPPHPNGSTFDQRLRMYNYFWTEIRPAQTEVE